jgi:hypothetical protein
MLGAKLLAIGLDSDGNYPAGESVQFSSALEVDSWG